MDVADNAPQIPSTVRKQFNEKNEHIQSFVTSRKYFQPIHHLRRHIFANTRQLR